MKLITTNHFLFFAFTLLFSSINAQTDSIRVRFIGNCGIHLSDGKTNIYSDFPYKSGAYHYMEFENSELDAVQPNSIFLFTHKHADHFSGKNMRRVLKAKSGKKCTPRSLRRLQKVCDMISNFTITEIKTKHRFSLKHRSYLIEWNGKRIYISGDTEHAEAIGQHTNLDTAFVPYWLIMDAKDKSIKIDAKQIIVYHIADVQIPSAKEGLKAPYHPLVDQGEVFYID